jgi:aryl-alcohol dehydrogenase-like predicted oxidoreductase
MLDGESPNRRGHARAALRGVVMPVHQVPRRAVALTELGLGVSQFGNLYRKTTDEEARSAVDAAWVAGIRYFDTAPHYGLGLSERRLGALLADRPRNEYVLSTKVGRLLVPSPETAGERDDQGFDVPATHRRVWDFSRDGVRRSLDASLDRLGLDRVDVVYLHDPDQHWEEASRQAVPALTELRDQGVIGAVGVGMNQSAMLADFISQCDIDLAMCASRYTILGQEALRDMLPAALDRGVGVVIAGVYNSGLLAQNRPATNARYDYEAAPGDVVARVHRIADVCERYGVTVPAAALAFVRAHPAVIATVVGARSGSQVDSNVARARTPIPGDLWAELRVQGLLDPDAPVPADSSPS